MKGGGGSYDDDDGEDDIVLECFVMVETVWACVTGLGRMVTIRPFL